MFFSSLFTITVLRPEHFAIMLPIIFILFAKFLDNLLFRKKLKFIFYSIIIVITLFNLLTLVSSYKVLNAIGTIPPQQYMGWHHPSDSIYKLSDYLLQNKIYEPITLGSGIAANIWFLTDLKIKPPMCQNIADFEDCIKLDTQKYYLITLQHVSYKWHRLFKELLNKYNKTAVVKKSFTRRDNTPEILVLEVKDGKIPSNVDEYFERFS